MPGTKRGASSFDGDGVMKRARALDGGVAGKEPPIGPDVAHLDELGFESECAAPVKLVNSGRRCESAWAAFEGKAMDLRVNLESRSEDVRAFVRVKCVPLDLLPAQPLVSLLNHLRTPYPQLGSVIVR
tara:strand:+ start:34610 stop:34993 length:384 start_codon:yes stop_codon:yes gene_type:complete